LEDEITRQNNNGLPFEVPYAKSDFENQNEIMIYTAKII